MPCTVLVVAEADLDHLHRGGVVQLLAGVFFHAIYEREDGDQGRHADDDAQDGKYGVKKMGARILSNASLMVADNFFMAACLPTKEVRKKIGKGWVFRYMLGK